MEDRTDGEDAFCGPVGVPEAVVAPGVKEEQEGDRKEGEGAFFGSVGVPEAVVAPGVKEEGEQEEARGKGEETREKEAGEEVEAREGAEGAAVAPDWQGEDGAADGQRRMVTRKRDISHATAAVRFSPLAPSSSLGKEGGGASGKKGAGGRGPASNEEEKGGAGGGGAANAKKSKKKGGGGGGKGRKGRKGRGVNQDLIPDWLNPGAQGREAGARAEAANHDEEYVRMTVAPRDFEVEDVEGNPVVLSKVHKGNNIQLSEDQLSVTSWKGYRLVRATRGVQDGAWYFEIKVVHLGSTGHVRLGWVTSRADVQAPVGFDSYGYAYREMDGSKVFEALRTPYAEPYKEGDVIGCYISLPGGGQLAPKPRKLAVYKGHNFYVEELLPPGPGQKAEEKAPVVVKGSEVVFYRNGVCQGTAFQDLVAELYFPAVSLYALPEQTEGASVTFNFGPDFEFQPREDAWGEDVRGQRRAPGAPVQLARALATREHRLDLEELKGEAQGAVTAQDAATAQDTAMPQDTATAKDTEMAQDASTAQDTVWTQDAATAQGTVPAQDAVTAQDTATAQDAVKATATATAQDTVIARDPAKQTME